MIRVPDGTAGGRRIRNLWVSKTEITWNVYDVYAYRLDMTPQQAAAGVDAASRPTKPYGAPDRGYGHNGWPALGIAFNAAEQFAKWLSKKSGRTYRLPTEAEWEYVARADSAKDPADVGAVAWVWENADDMAQPVGRKPANAWGLHDTLGNVAEWVVGADGKPVTCGGSFRDRKTKVGFETRAKWSPSWQERDPQKPKSKWWLSDGPHVGFRLVTVGNP